MLGVQPREHVVTFGLAQSVRQEAIRRIIDVPTDGPFSLPWLGWIKCQHALAGAVERDGEDERRTTHRVREKLDAQVRGEDDNVRAILRPPDVTGRAFVKHDTVSSGREPSRGHDAFHERRRWTKIDHEAP